MNRNRHGWKERVLDEVKRVGRMQGNMPGSGPKGSCVCPECGYSMKHQRGIPCYKTKCPECGSLMKKTK